ncbi:hypothetical protein J7368_01040, partial [Xanthomonas phaseoli pv. dieffenbachiae]|nr:hypothetical protein [Xanthomonas phaseoli pv. dieffenbachiae]
MKHEKAHRKRCAFFLKHIWQALSYLGKTMLICPVLAHMMHQAARFPDSRFPIPDSRFPIPDSRFPIPDSRISN